jgi:hypothetical protein
MDSRSAVVSNCILRVPVRIRGNALRPARQVVIGHHPVGADWEGRKAWEMSESDEYALRIGNSTAPVPLISHFSDIKWGSSPVRPDVEDSAIRFIPVRPFAFPLDAYSHIPTMPRPNFLLIVADGE